jgi:GTP-binding protein
MALRNIAIIAHVDHGKTTLVDQMFRQSGTFRDNQQVAERAMDSNAQERERGITILAKVTSVEWKGDRINIVDTPGHADFGGEVERILGMVDGVVLLCDAAEGPLPQTKFVLAKALKRGIKPIVVINKIDRPDAEIDKTLDAVFDLFVALEATDKQLDFPILYAVGRDGWAGLEPVIPAQKPEKGLAPLFDKIIEYVPTPHDVDPTAPFKLLVTMMHRDPFLGRLVTGRIESGTVKMNQAVHCLDRDGNRIEAGRITKILAFRGLERVPLETAEAGDIVMVAGLEKATVAQTVCDTSVTTPCAAQPIDPPIISMTFRVNDSPLVGRDGDKVTSRLIRDRLFREAESNVALKVEDGSSMDSFKVSGRGELQLGVLIESMRREGFELGISRPEVIFKKDENGQLMEPTEEVVIDVDQGYMNTVMQKMTERKAELQESIPSSGGKQRMTFIAVSRGLIGYYSEFLTDTRGTGIMNRLFHGYTNYKGKVGGRRNGALISMEAGQATAYALMPLEERGRILIEPTVDTYAGMIIGEHSRENDLEVNVQKTKKLTNMRASGKDEAIRLTPPPIMTLEWAMTYINDDELVEVTPKFIRLRKAILDPNAREKARKASDRANENAA